MQWTDGTHRTRSEKDGVSKTRGMTRHFSLLRSSGGKLKNETKRAPLSGRKVTLGRRGNIGKEPDTAIPPCPDQPSNTNFHHFLPAANRAVTGDRGKAYWRRSA